MARNPANDITFWVPTPFDFNFTFEGEYLSTIFLAEDFDFGVELEGNWAHSYLFLGKDLDFNLTLEGLITLAGQRRNWLKWSKIAEFDFTIDKSNVAGEAPLDWVGSIWKIGKLPGHVVVYGSNGVVRLAPHENVYSPSILYGMGVKGKGSILCAGYFHIFIDSAGCLWEVGEGLQKLGYEEFLEPLVNPIMSYDVLTDRIFICDGDSGFVYSHASRSMGQGPANITGIGYREGTSYVFTSDGLTIPSVLIESSPIDFGIRKFKILQVFDIGHDFNAPLEIGISFKNTSSASFTAPLWFPVTPDGRAFPQVNAKEFKLHLRGSPSSGAMDYIKIRGHISDFGVTDI